MVEYPLGSVSILTELPEEIYTVTWKASFKTLGGITERYCSVEYLQVFRLHMGLECPFNCYLKSQKLSVKVIITS